MKFKGLLSLMCVAQVSFGAPIFCTGGGWELVTSNHQKTAKLTLRGKEVQFGDLACESVWLKSNPPKLDSLICRTAAHVYDAGFTAKIKLELPGIDMTGKLTETTIAGARDLADLKCVAAAN